MGRISSKVIKKKSPTIEDTVFGGDTKNNGSMVRYDMEQLAALIKSHNYTGSEIKQTKNSYFPSGW
jgi:hypothetical protein